MVSFDGRSYILFERIFLSSGISDEIKQSINHMSIEAEGFFRDKPLIEHYKVIRIYQRTRRPLYRVPCLLFLRLSKKILIKFEVYLKI